MQKSYQETLSKKYKEKIEELVGKVKSYANEKDSLRDRPVSDTTKYYEDMRLRDELKNISILFETLYTKIDARIAILEKKENKATKRKETSDDNSENSKKQKKDEWKQVQENLQKCPQKIILNIGGKHFASTKDTLFSKKDSFFYTMISSGKWTPDEDGTYFIDRDPKYFRYLLNYLRNGICPDLSDLSRVQLKELKKEANFYCLDEMFGDSNNGLLSLDILTKEGCIQSEISQKKVTITAITTITNNPGPYANIYNLTKMEKGTFTWKVKVKEIGLWLALGVVQANRVEQKAFNDFVSPYNSHGCYMFSFNSYSWEPKSHYQNKFSFKNGDELELKMNCELKKLTITNISVGNHSVSISDISPEVYPCFVANGKVECEMKWISHYE